QRARHVVDGFSESRDFALRVYGELLSEVAGGDGRHDFHDAAHLLGEVGRHDVDVVGEVFPRAGHAGYFGLTAEFSFGADFTRHAVDFAGESVQLIEHGVDGVLQLENFAFHVNRDFAREVALRHGGGYFGQCGRLC